VKLKLSTTKLTGLSLLSIALAAAVASTSSCSPADKSVGTDTSKAGSDEAPGQAGAPVTTSAGAPAMPSAGAPSTNAGTGNQASGGSGNATSAGAPAVTDGGAPAAAGSGNSGGKGGGPPAAGGAPPAGGGAPAVGGAGASTPGGDSKCAALSGATFCDGFENGMTDWTVKGAGVTVDTTKFFRGKSSLKYSSADMAYAVEKKTFAGATKQTNNAFWARYFVLAGVSTYPAGHTVFGTLADTADATDPNRFHFVGGSRQKLMAEIRITGDNYTNKGQGQMPDAMAPPFPVVADGWKCWEFQVTADDSFAFYIEGAEITDMKITKGIAVASGKSFSPLPIFGQLQIGWQAFGGGGTVVSGWIDEVAIGPNRIGCNN
jgi:hypothetical protein